VFVLALKSQALSSLHNLKNFNLLGNPIAEKVKLLKKVRAMSLLLIFNNLLTSS